MRLNVTKEAAACYKEEMDLRDGEALRLFVQYGGVNQSPVPGFSFGVQKEQPSNTAISMNVEGITFFIREEDMWCLNDCRLTVCRNGLTEEIQFVFTKTE